MVEVVRGIPLYSDVSELLPEDSMMCEQSYCHYCEWLLLGYRFEKRWRRRRRPLQSSNGDDAEMLEASNAVPYGQGSVRWRGRCFFSGSRMVQYQPLQTKVFMYSIASITASRFH